MNIEQINSVLVKAVMNMQSSEIDAAFSSVVEMVEAVSTQWSANGYLEIKTFGPLTSKDVNGIKYYVKRWADGMLPGGKKWKVDDVSFRNGKLVISFLTDGKPNSMTFDNIASEVIGDDGAGGMLWQFAVKDVSSPDNLERRLYGGNWQADDPMYPLVVVNQDIIPSVGF